jgi:hypothetical protein
MVLILRVPDDQAASTAEWLLVEQNFRKLPPYFFST